MYNGRIVGDGQWLHGFPCVGMDNVTISSRIWGWAMAPRLPQDGGWVYDPGSTAFPVWGWVFCFRHCVNI